MKNGYGKVILLSATLFDAELKELLPNRSYLAYEVQSPIEASRRQILYSPTDVPMTYPRPIEEISYKVD